MTAPLNSLVEKIEEALWDATPTHCEVSWKEATTLFKHDKQWQRSVEEHRKAALAAAHAEEMRSILLKLAGAHLGDRQFDEAVTYEVWREAEALLAKMDGAS